VQLASSHGERDAPGDASKPEPIEAGGINMTSTEVAHRRVAVGFDEVDPVLRQFPPPDPGDIDRIEPF
jgi:hypothetical protein